jgi:hypothetical protein
VGSSTRSHHPEAEVTCPTAQLSESLEVLNHSVEDLREDIRGHMSEMRELSGRVEFAERLLTEKREQ